MYDQNFKVKPLATLCRMYPLLGGNVYVTLVYCKETVYCLGVLACIMMPRTTQEPLQLSCITDTVAH